ncbi:DUF2062 domain-containing protein [Pseudotabrizicola sp. L79]|uniref:DUF2062 domain-containing protein n=1 Tax=Pseudotabrizicola sp. L79 TaxID=3118402 RepID=UPI002F94EC49
MVFRRRKKRTILEWLYPRGGWFRAGSYIWHRLTRLPDPPHRIARGVWAGVFISFTPLFGFHFFGAALLAWIMRGNFLAAILATFFGNPITFPLIAFGSVKLGHLLLGTGREAVPPSEILSAFAFAGGEVWNNILAIFTSDVAKWSHLAHFYYGLFKPYLVGGLLPGIVAATLCYYISLPMIAAYQALRQKRRRARAEKLRSLAAQRLRAKAAADDDRADDDRAGET